MVARCRGYDRVPPQVSKGNRTRATVKALPTSTQPPSPLMNVDDRMGQGGGLVLVLGGNAIHWGLRGAPQRGKAPGPLIHSTPPLVPTGPWAASTSMEMITRFGRQTSLSAVGTVNRPLRVAGVVCQCASIETRSASLR